MSQYKLLRLESIYMYSKCDVNEQSIDIKFKSNATTMLVLKDINKMQSLVYRTDNFYRQFHAYRERFS